MPTYEDGTQAKVGDVVIENGRPERYIILGFDGNSASTGSTAFQRSTSAP
jgi:hypothetical protein